MTSFNPTRAEVQALIDIAKEHSAKKKRDAHKLWRQAAERSRELLGATHEATVFCQNNVGKSLVDIGNYEEAIPLLEAALRQSQAIYGYTHFSVEHVCQSLAHAYKARGDHATAYKHWMAAGNSSEALRGLNNQTTIFCFHQAARRLASQRLFDQALPLLQKVIEANKKVHGFTVNSAFSARDLATCLNQLERFEEALPFWKLALRIFEQDANQKDLADKAYRCMNWTRVNVRERRRVEQRLMLSGVEKMGDQDKNYLLGLNLTTKQMAAVVAHLQSTYLNGDEHEHADSLRVAVKGRDKQVAAYKKIAEEGCCGSEDTELKVREDNGNVDTIYVGFNFGH